MNTNEGELLAKEEVYAIVGAAMEVYNQLGAGFAEAVYQEAMEIELKLRSIPFTRQQRLKIFYKGVELECAYVADLVCFGSVIVELKTMKQTTQREEGQLINYLKATKLRVGLLINFSDPGRLDWHRFDVPHDWWARFGDGMKAIAGASDVPTLCKGTEGSGVWAGDGPRLRAIQGGGATGHS